MPYHSTGLLAGESVDALQQKITRAPYAAAWTRLCERWRGIARRKAETGSLSYGALAWHSITPALVDAGLIYRLSGDAEALAFVADGIRDLLAVHADPARLAKLPGGRHPVHSHAEAALAADLCRDGLPPELFSQLLDLVRERLIDDHPGADYLRSHGAGGNIPFCQMENAGVVALVLGEEAGHPGWETVVDLARDGCLQYLRHGMDAAGYSYEGPGYCHGVLAHLYRFAYLLYRHGRDDLFAREERLALLNDAYLSLLFPDRSAVVNINDLGLGSCWSFPWLLFTAQYYGRPQDMGFWHAFQGPDHPTRPFGEIETLNNLPTLVYTLLWWDAGAPVQPIAESRLPLANYAPGTETANFRTGWDVDAVYVNVRGQGRGHTSQGHHHADCGHFSVFAYGDYLAIDTGRYNVDEDQHNVVLVDGACHLPTAPGWGINQRAGRLAEFQRHPLLDYARADAAAVKDCVWADRHFLFLRGEGDDCCLVVIDNINRDHQHHAYWWQLHAHPEAAIEITGAHTAAIRGDTGRLDLFFAAPEPGDYPQAPHTLALRTDEAWWGWPYGKEQDTSVHERGGLQTTSLRRPRLIAELQGLNCMLLTVLSPRRIHEPPRTIRRHAAPHLFHLEIDRGAYTDTIISALDHGYIKLPEVEGFTELAVIRRQPDGTVLDYWTPDGTTLSYGKYSGG